MQVFRKLDNISQRLGPTVVSIGNFDGVHLGHRFILDRLRQSAAARSLRSVAVTFDPHPLRFLRPETCPKLITPLETRIELLEEAGVDAVLVLPFTAELSRMRAAEFVTAIVHDALQAVEVHEGPNFRFGYRAEGGIRRIERTGPSAWLRGGGSWRMPGTRIDLFEQQDQGVVIARRPSYRPRTAGTRIFHRFDAGSWTRDWFYADGSYD